MKLNDLTGSIFGRLTVLGRADGYQRVYWACQCKCGETVDVQAASLIGGKTVSCGCYAAEVSRLKRDPSPGNMNRKRPYTFGDFKGHARVRGVDVSITGQDWIELMTNPCHYCGQVRQSRGIDRVDSSVGYELGNCVSACWICNRWKNADMGLNDMVQHALDFLRHQNVI